VSYGGVYIRGSTASNIDDASITMKVINGTNNGTNPSYTIVRGGAVGSTTTTITVDQTTDPANPMTNFYQVNATGGITNYTRCGDTRWDT